MRYIIDDTQYHFKSAFDTQTGTYIRTGVLDENGVDTGIDPFMASFPHLIDVGVMGHCIHGKTGLCAKAGIGCYQSGLLVEQPNMTVEDFRWIAQQCRGRCNQLALGGRGDPDQHEHFEELLKISRENIFVRYTKTVTSINTPHLPGFWQLWCVLLHMIQCKQNQASVMISMVLPAFLSLVTWIFWGIRCSSSLWLIMPTSL